MISLIVATLHRVVEVEKLLASLDIQTYKNFEVLIVDQNPDARLMPVLQRHPTLSIRHLRSAQGLSRARNVGLPLAKGDIIAFPDDDCWYPPDLLSSITRWFESHPEFGCLFACLRSANNLRVGPRNQDQACTCTREVLLYVALAATGFLRREAAQTIGLFDECIGAGAPTPYQSGEDLDYFLRPLALGLKMKFEPSFTVRHPSLHSPERLRRTTYGYALGGAYVLRIHGYSWWYMSRQVVRSLGGALVSFLKADLENARIYLLRAAGQLRGYFWGPRDLARLRAGAG